MAIFSLLRVEPSIINVFTVLVGALFLYAFGSIIYNIYFHPLAKFPGPLIWRATRLGFVYSLVRGNLVTDVHEIHKKYGDIVRLAPDELSFAKEEAWHEVLATRAGHKVFPKNPVFWKAPPNQPANLAGTIDAADHARQRKLIAESFTESALNRHESIVQSYVSLLMSKLRGQLDTSVQKRSSGVIDIVNWYNFFLFDMIGDLTFGESFDCLQGSQYHPWVAMMFDFIKGMTFAMATRYYPVAEYLLNQMIPKSIKKVLDDHLRLTKEKTHRRLNLEKQRVDFMTPIIEKNADFKVMTLNEIEVLAALLILAGSETTATALSGTTNALIQNPVELQKLVSEIRTTFKYEEEITFAAVKELPFLNAVIHEGLRLCNPVPAGLPRIVPQGGDTVLGHFLPEYTQVSVNPTALYQSPTNFARPTSFLPDRWLPTSSRPSEFNSDKRTVMRSFGLGSRNCLGQFLAWAQMRVVLARMVWNFDMEVVEDRRVDWNTLKTFIFVEKKPILVRLTERQI